MAAKFLGAEGPSTSGGSTTSGMTKLGSFLEGFSLRKSNKVLKSPSKTGYSGIQITISLHGFASIAAASLNWTISSTKGFSSNIYLPFRLASQKSSKLLRNPQDRGAADTSLFCTPTASS